MYYRLRRKIDSGFAECVTDDHYPVQYEVIVTPHIHRRTAKVWCVCGKTFSGYWCPQTTGYAELLGVLWDLSDCGLLAAAEVAEAHLVHDGHKDL